MNNLLNVLTLVTANASVDLPDELSTKLDTIRIPLFLDLSAFSGNSATVWSFLAFIGSVLTVALVAFWIFKVIQLGVEGIQSEGKQEKIQELVKKLQNILLGVFMTFLFPIILTIIGIFAGIGSIFEWPRMFRSCPSSSTYEYYFQAFINFDGADATMNADLECGFASEVAQ